MLYVPPVISIVSVAIYILLFCAAEYIPPVIFPFPDIYIFRALPLELIVPDSNTISFVDLIPYSLLTFEVLV